MDKYTTELVYDKDILVKRIISKPDWRNDIRGEYNYKNNMVISAIFKVNSGRIDIRMIRKGDKIKIVLTSNIGYYRIEKYEAYKDVLNIKSLYIEAYGVWVDINNNIDYNTIKYKYELHPYHTYKFRYINMLTNLLDPVNIR